MYNNLSFFRRWHIFIKERFSPIEHIILIIFFFFANSFIAALSINQLNWQLTKDQILGFFVILYVFFHMRVFDEIKDYKNDLKVNPQRPLARGVISVKEAKIVGFFLVFLEILISFFISLEVFVSSILVCVYTLIMYKEFFIGDWLRPRLATYAMAHTIVSSWMALYVFSCVNKMFFWQSPIEFWFFAFSNWMIFNIFEFGRKTYGKEEERELVDSYSKRLGVWRAALNVVFMALIAFLIAIWLGWKFNIGITYFILMSSLLLLIICSAIFYARNNNFKWGKLFRKTCSIFILFYNLIIVLGILIKR